MYDTQLAREIGVYMGTYHDYQDLEELKFFDKGYTVQANFPGPQGNDGTFKRIFYGGQTAKFEAV